MQKLKEIIYYFLYAKSSATAGLFVLREGRPLPYGVCVSFVGEAFRLPFSMNGSVCKNEPSYLLFAVFMVYSN